MAAAIGTGWQIGAIDIGAIPSVINTELIANPTFDANILDWTPTATTILARDTAVFYEGGGALRMSASVAGVIKTVSGSFPVDPALLYSFSGRLRAGSTTRSSAIQVDWRTLAGTYISSDFLYLPNSTSWTLRELTDIVPPVNAATGEVALVVNAVALGENHYFDSLTARARAVSAPSLLVNPTFDATILSWNAATNTTLTHETTTTYGGSAGSLEMTTTVTGEAKASSEQFAIDPTKLYNFGVYTRAGTTSRSAGLQIDWWDAGGVYISSLFHYATNTTGWVLRQVLGVQPPAGAITATVALVINSVPVGELHYFDSVTAELVGSAPPPDPDPDPDPEPSLVANPTFNTNILSWTPTANTVATHETANVFEGAGSLRVTAVATGEVKIVSSRFAVDTSLLYQFSVQCKTAVTPRSTSIQADWFTSAGAYISSNFLYTPNTTNWVLRELAAIAPPANAANGEVSLVINSVAAGEIHYFDAVVARVSGTATPPDPVTGNELWRPNFTQGIASFSPDALYVNNGASHSFPVVSGTTDPSGREAHWWIANQDASKIAIRTWFDSISLADKSEIYWSYEIWVPSNGIWNVGGESPKMFGGAFGLTRSKPISSVAAGGIKPSDAWSFRHYGLCADYLKRFYGSHPACFGVYLYAEIAEGRTRQQATNGYGIELPARSNNGTGSVVPMLFNQWVRIEGYCKVGATDNRDGIARLWQNGQLVIDATDVTWNTTGNRRLINGFISETFWNQAAGGNTIRHRNFYLASSRL